MKIKKNEFCLPMKFRSGWTTLGCLEVHAGQLISLESISPSFSEKKNHKHITVLLVKALLQKKNCESANTVNSTSRYNLFIVP
jgi:hypothetical protein